MSLDIFAQLHGVHPWGSGDRSDAVSRRWGRRDRSASSSERSASDREQNVHPCFFMTPCLHQIHEADLANFSVHWRFKNRNRSLFLELDAENPLHAAALHDPCTMSCSRSSYPIGPLAARPNGVRYPAPAALTHARRRPTAHFPRLRGCRGPRPSAPVLRGDACSAGVLCRRGRSFRGRTGEVPPPSRDTRAGVTTKASWIRQKSK